MVGLGDLGGGAFSSIAYGVSGWTKLTEAYGVSGDGTTIVGHGTRLSDGSSQAFHVSDTGRFGLGALSGGSAPEPATLALFTLGLWGPLWYVRRRKA